MASPNITHENNSRIINGLIDCRAALFARVWAEGGRDFTAIEQGTLDIVNTALLFSEPKTVPQAGGVLETAIELLQLFRHGETGVSLAAVEGALCSVLGVLAAPGGYQPVIYGCERHIEGASAH